MKHRPIIDLVLLAMLALPWILIARLTVGEDTQPVDEAPVPRLLVVDKVYHLDGTQPCVAMFWDDGHVYTASPNDLTTWTLAAHVTPSQENP